MRVEEGSGPRYRRSGSLSSSGEILGRPCNLTLATPPHNSKFTVSQGSCASLGESERWLGFLCVYCNVVVESKSKREKIVHSDNLMKINKNMAKFGERGQYYKLKNYEIKPYISVRNKTFRSIGNQIPAQSVYQNWKFTSNVFAQFPSIEKDVYKQSIIHRSYARVK